MKKYIVLVLILLAGCKPVPAPIDDVAGHSTDTPAASPATEGAAVAGGGEFGETLLWLEPLVGCGNQQVSKIHWSKEAVAKGVANIELGDDVSSVFARIGDAGEKETGAWAYPGLSITLRTAEGKVIARQVFKAENKCPEVVK